MDLVKEGTATTPKSSNPPEDKEETLSTEKQAVETNAVNSLALLAAYNSSSDSESDSESSSSSSSSSSSESGAEEVVISNTTTYREAPMVVESSDGESEEEGSDDEVKVKSPSERPASRQRTGIKAKGELDLSDLPPIEELQISVREEECLFLGKILSIVEQMVLVETKRGNAVLDLDTVLFVERGHKVLGKIFDVLGPIDQPIYCIRFNTAKEIADKGFTVGMDVFWVAKPEHSSIVVVPNLMQQKGSDASWEHDIEPPEGCLDYSDDEQERSIRRNRRQNRRPEEAPRQVPRGQRRRQQPVAHYPNLNWYQYPPPPMPTWGPVYVNPFAYQANIPFTQPPPPPPPQNDPPVKMEHQEPPPPGCT